MMRTVSVLTLTVVLFGSPFLKADNAAQTPPPAPVQGMNEVSIVVPDDATANQLVDLFHNKLKLPQVWPYQSFGSFSGSGLYAGNTNTILQVVKFNPDPTGAVSPNQYLLGFACLDLNNVTLPFLDNAGITHTPRIPGTFTAPVPFTGDIQAVSNDFLNPLPNQTGDLWELAFITNITQPTIGIEVINYFVNLNWTYGRAAQETLGELLQKDTLGWMGIRTVELGTADVPGETQKFTDLLGSGLTARDGVSPQLRIVNANTDTLVQLDVRVQNLNKAKNYLRKAGLLGNETEGAVFLKSPLLGSLKVRFIE